MHKSTIAATCDKRFTSSFYLYPKIPPVIFAKYFGITRKGRRERVFIAQMRQMTKVRIYLGGNSEKKEIFGDSRIDG